MPVQNLLNSFFFLFVQYFITGINFTVSTKFEHFEPIVLGGNMIDTEQENMTLKWQNGDLSNFDYLIFLNR